MISKSDIASYQKARSIFEKQLYLSIKQEVFKIIEQAIKRVVINGTDSDIVLTYADVLTHMPAKNIKADLNESFQDITAFAEKDDVIRRATTVSKDGVQKMAQEVLEQLHDQKALARMITKAVSEYINKTDLSASGSEFSNGANISRLVASSQIITIRLDRL